MHDECDLTGHFSRQRLTDWQAPGTAIRRISRNRKNILVGIWHKPESIITDIQPQFFPVDKRAAINCDHCRLIGLVVFQLVGKCKLIAVIDNAVNSDGDMIGAVFRNNCLSGLLQSFIRILIATGILISKEPFQDGRFCDSSISNHHSHQKSADSGNE